MKLPMSSVLAIVALLGSLLLVHDDPARIPVIGAVASPTDKSIDHAGVVEAYGELPLSFEPNRGQINPSVDFLARGSGYTLSVSAGEAVLSLRTAVRAPESSDTMLAEPQRERARPNKSTTVIRMKIVGGASDAVATAKDELPGKVNTFIGSDPAKWRTNIPTYAKVVYASVYPEIDLAYYGDQGRLEYDFIVRPGSDPAAIALRFEGPDEVQLDADGNLVLRVGAQKIRQMRPLAYQDIDGKRRQVPIGYRLGAGDSVGFDVGDHDRTVPVVIDPVLAYSTFLGGFNSEEGVSIAVDALGNAYVTGDTTSPDFPTTLGSFQPAQPGPQDVFVTKLGPLGNTLVYSTFLGGADDDVGRAIALDASGAAYVTGQSKSTNFPTTLGAFQTAVAGGKDVFVTKISPLGNALLYSTYLGGSDEEGGLGIVVDPSSDAVVTGYSVSTNFPTTLGVFQSASGGNADAFVTKLNPLGSALLYSTYIGGNSNEEGTGIALDASNSPYLVGFTTSGNYPTSIGAPQPAIGGIFDAFATKLSPLANAILYSTYLGGSENDSGQGIAVDASGSAYVTGYTRSTNYPTTLGAFQTANAGTATYDVVVTKINPLGNAFTYSTYLGGSGDDQGNSIAVDASGNAYVTGWTLNSTDFPTASAFQTAKAAGFDAFVMKLKPSGNALEYSSYLGASGDEFGFGIAVDASGNAYITGRTSSIDFPTTFAFQPTPSGSDNAFVAKVGLLASTALCTVTLNEGGWITAANGDMATFNGVVMTDAQGNLSGHESYKDHGPIQAMDVDSTTLLAVTCSDDRTTASIFGQATIDGSGDHLFRIDMVDGSQSGADDKYGISLDNGYMSGLQPLGGGNIVIH